MGVIAQWWGGTPGTQPGHRGLLTNYPQLPLFLKKKKHELCFQISWLSRATDQLLQLPPFFLKKKKKVNSVFKQQGPTDAGFPFIP